MIVVTGLQPSRTSSHSSRTARYFLLICYSEPEVPTLPPTKTGYVFDKDGIMKYNFYPRTLKSPIIALKDPLKLLYGNLATGEGKYYETLQTVPGSAVWASAISTLEKPNPVFIPNGQGLDQIRTMHSMLNTEYVYICGQLYLFRVNIHTQAEHFRQVNVQNISPILKTVKELLYSPEADLLYPIAVYRDNNPTTDSYSWIYFHRRIDLQQLYVYTHEVNYVIYHATMDNLNSNRYIYASSIHGISEDHMIERIEVSASGLGTVNRITYHSGTCCFYNALMNFGPYQYVVTMWPYVATSLRCSSTSSPSRGQISPPRPTTSPFGCPGPSLASFRTRITSTSVSDLD
jgi:hypothetical protein